MRWFYSILVRIAILFHGLEPLLQFLKKYILENVCESSLDLGHLFRIALIFKVRKRAKIKNRYNQAPHLTKDTNGKVITSQ